ncbi:MAG TPA: hypothetical protein PLQ56_18800 [Aggregatilineales bacterium]|nr:hypothetical protein [Aggregatilineales bacterium]
MRRKLLLLVLPALLIMAVVICVLAFSNPWAAQTRGEMFILHLLAGRELEAHDMAASSLTSLAKTTCPDGKLHECATRNLLTDWGALREIRFAIGSAQYNSELFHLFFTGLDTPISVVLVYSDGGAKSAVEGWRGFVPSEGEETDRDLLDGRLDVNHFGKA